MTSRALIELIFKHEHVANMWDPDLRSKASDDEEGPVLKLSPFHILLNLSRAGSIDSTYGHDLCPAIRHKIDQLSEFEFITHIHILTR